MTTGGGGGDAGDDGGVSYITADREAVMGAHTVAHTQVRLTDTHVCWCLRADRSTSCALTTFQRWRLSRGRPVDVRRYDIAYTRVVWKTHNKSLGQQFIGNYRRKGNRMCDDAAPLDEYKPGTEFGAF